MHWTGPYSNVFIVTAMTMTQSHQKTHAWQVVFSFLEPILNQTRQWCLVNGADHLTSFAGAQMETRRAGPERQAPLKPPVRGGKAARAKRFKRTNKK